MVGGREVGREIAKPLRRRREEEGAQATGSQTLRLWLDLSARREAQAAEALGESI